MREAGPAELSKCYFSDGHVALSRVISMRAGRGETHPVATGAPSPGGFNGGRAGREVSTHLEAPPALASKRVDRLRSRAEV